MKVRMIGGIREIDHKDPLCGVWLEPVLFPMAVINYDAADLSDPDELVLNSEDELISWAENAFDEVGYQIFDIEIPTTYGASGYNHDANHVLDLISAKKAEYQHLAPSTPEAQSEVDAVVAALDTLHIHASGLLPQESPTTSL